MNWAALAAVPAAAFLIAVAATRMALGWLRARAILDRPNERSSHAVPTPRGGGIGLLAGLLPAWTGIALALPGADPVWPLLLAAALLLAALSFADDLKGLSARVRFAAQLAAVAVVLAAMQPEDYVFQGLLPLWLDRILTALAWLWFVNLFNFMDGIDGISGVEAASIGIGVALIGWLASSLTTVGFGLALAGAALGFLVWNWSPARVFLGDVGSIPVGFLGGWLLIRLAQDGAWAAALILPAYYLGDATLTLLRRAWRRERLWQAHRSHFYQQAVQRGCRHADVSRAVLFTNLGLGLLAWVSLQGFGWLALAPAAALVCWRLARFGRGEA